MARSVETTHVSGPRLLLGRDGSHFGHGVHGVAWLERETVSASVGSLVVAAGWGGTRKKGRERSGIEIC